MKKKKIGILTAGGDAPGLNAVIYSLVRACHKEYDLIGYKFGYRGLYLNDFMPLTLESTSGILHKGGSILRSSNSDNLFIYPIMENGEKVKKDVSDVAVANMKKEGVDVLVVLGGDGSLTSARDFSRKGINVVGVPKTIDNDLPSTDATFGFDSAVNVVTESLGRIHTTAESHDRVIVVEVMGRSAGWIALHSGIAGSADVILIPEIPYTIDGIVAKINERNAKGKRFTIVVVTEGAVEKDGGALTVKNEEDRPDPTRFGGVGQSLEERLKNLVENDVRHSVLGYIQRGGETSAADRLLSVRYGVHAAELIKKGDFGKMVCVENGEMSSVPLAEVVGEAAIAIGGAKIVDPKGELVKAAKALGISFADE